MSASELPMNVQQQLARLQQLQQTLAALLSEKQRIQSELEEIKLALEELSKVDESVIVYKAVGPLLIQTAKEKVVTELSEKRDLNDTRLKVLEKQEARTRSQIASLQKEIQMSLGTGRSEES
ncbi:MAG: prefoldin subunit beta [Thaumarchaeota archaeon]|nr:prefoldin subunit beta [Candidatus Calditenuaceae archaeon]MDW8187327.1 prefoldin subunit beta [Nitrososphaerota archaeon]